MRHSLKDLVQEIVDAAKVVHDTLGPGFLEGIYARALISELRNRGLALEREKQVKIWYGSQVVGKHNLDLIVERTAIVELKANHGLVPIHAAQLRSYLQATDCAVGILVNFGTSSLQWEVMHRQLVAEKSD
jgi:GxxExxY protein